MRTQAGRYSLEDRVLDGAGWSYWRGYDGVLRRPVGVLALDPGNPYEDDVLAAARASAAVVDPRVQQVLDALTDDEGTCLVIEWTAGTALEDLLGDGPLADVESWRVTLEVGRALAVADARGLRHGALGPRWVLRGDGGRVRLLGLCVARALEGGPEATAADDARGLGALLYAGLTARWPGDPAASSLPVPPTQGGRPVRPRMVRAGVPTTLDDVASRALGLPGRGEPLTSPAEVVEALERAGAHMRGFDASEPADLDASALAGLENTGYVERVAAATGEVEPVPPRSRRLLLAAALAAGALVLTTGTAVVVRALSQPAGTPSRAGGAAASSSAVPTAAPTGARIAISTVTDFDPPPGNGTENTGQVALATDGDQRTAWHTLQYRKRPNLGGLKPGVGLLVDLGTSQTVGAVRLRLVGHGTSVELRAAASREATADGYITVAHADGTGELVTLRPDEPLRARYLLVWLTSLPLAPDGVNYQGGVAEIEVYRS